MSKSSTTYRNMIPSKKRLFTNIHNKAIEQELSKEPWYALKPEEIVVQVEDMCDNLAASLAKYAPIDQRYQEAVDAANAKRKLPEITQFNVAVVGEQGIGKSSVINALLDRGLLDRSGSSRACTAYATILEYKKGAPDETDLSDVSVQFFSETEVRHCINEQVDRWIEVHPGPQEAGWSSLCQDDDDEDFDQDNSGEDTTFHSRTRDISEEASRAADTAEEFFQIIFNVQEHVECGEWLKNELYHTNINERGFSALCFDAARRMFQDMARKKQEVSLERRKAHFTNVPDKTLWEQTAAIKRLWPFVKAVTIATGHILLRNGLRLFDIPGYGDTSQLREAVINHFRRHADFEMIIAPFSRVQTSVLQERYINLSVHLKGAEKTILVMNKSDTLINEDNIVTLIRHIKADPFPSIYARLVSLEIQQEQGTLDPISILNYMDQLLDEATIAYTKYETESVQKKMQSKGVKVFSVSALSYTTSRNALRKGNGVLDQKTAGIPELRVFLAKLPGTSNYKNYHDHVFEILPDLRNEAARPLETHPEDATYAAMRSELVLQIPKVQFELESVVQRGLDDSTERPWADNEAQDIAKHMEEWIKKMWVHPLIYHSGFAKMLRENGIPVNGKYYGHNLNRDLLRAMKKYYHRWYNNMSPKTSNFAQAMSTSVQNRLHKTLSAINRSSSRGGLKKKASEELSRVRQRIKKAYDTLVASLHSSLAETRLRFATEIDIKCPIAMAMKAWYERALDPGIVCSGNGTYRRRRNVLCASITNPVGTDPQPLLEKMGKQIQTKLRERWKMDYNAFISEAMKLLNGFSRTTEQLLRNPQYMTFRHKQARTQLKKLLADFDIRLKHIQNRFMKTEEEHAVKKSK